MIAALPSPYPDELLYSVFARYRMRMRYGGFKSGMRDLFGTAARVAVIDFPTHLNTFLGRILPRHPFTAESLIQGYTLLPYHRPFLPADRVALITAEMAGDGGNRVPSRIGTARSSVPDPPTLQYCRECAEADREEVGEAYWHRVHQLPGVLVCPKHFGPLYTTTIERVGRRSRVHFVALEEELQSVAKHEILKSPDSPHLLAIARDSLWLLASETPLRLDRGLPERYHALLQEAGWIRTGGRLRTRELRNATVAYFGQEFLERFGCVPIHGATDDWTSRVARSRLNAQSPLSHLLMIHLLGLSAQQFFEERPEPSRPITTPLQGWSTIPWLCPLCTPVEQAERHSGKGSEQPNPRKCPECGCIFRHVNGYVTPIVLSDLWKREIEKEATAEAPSIAQMTRRRWMYAKELREWLDHLGLPQPRSKAAPPDRELSPQMKEKRTEHRKALLKLKRKYPKATRSEIAGLNKAMFQFLWKNDREWFDDNMPAHLPRGRFGSRVNWAERDRELLTMAQSIVEQILNRPGRPIRVSRCSIAQHLPKLLRNAVLTRIQLIPETAAFIAEASENKEAFATRRLTWTAGEMRASGLRLTRSRLCISANLTPDVIASLGGTIERLLREPE